MKTGTLRKNQLSETAYQRYLSYLQAMDEKDLARYSGFLSEDCELQMNNQPPIHGKAAIVEMLGPYWQSFRTIEHELLNIFGTDTHYVLEALNHYIRHDGRPVSVRAVAFTDLEGNGLVESVRLYCDVSPVFE